MGRNSGKKTDLLRVYWNVRNSMDAEDVQELVRSHPDYEDPSDTKGDLEIWKKTLVLIDTMDKVEVLGREYAIPLRG